MNWPSVFLFLTLIPGILPAGVSAAGGPIPVSVKQGVKVAYEATNDTWEDGVAKALNTIKKQKEFYRDMGVAKGQLDLRGVFHSDAGYFLLTDQAYRRHTRTVGGNPNRSIIQELSEAGVIVRAVSKVFGVISFTFDETLLLSSSCPPPGLETVDRAGPDLRWTWSHESDALWRAMDPDVWEQAPFLSRKRRCPATGPLRNKRH